MSLPLARSMNVRVGTGIAGKVAKSGFPLLVQDIEKDSRIGMSNRPRFSTKSFISVPIRPKGETVGVLNLADKEDGGVFGEADLNLLSTFVAHAGVLLERITMLERASLLHELSVTDPLTGLFNRRFLEKRLEEELSRSARQNVRFSMILIDLDHFKQYNDLCGHIAGDNALRRVANLLKLSAREMDVVTRYGGEEFCVILPGTSKDESIFVADRIRRAIEREPFPNEASLPLKCLTASLGIASYPDDASTASALIHAADLALYQAKSTGRNRLILFEPAMRNREEGWTQATPSASHS
jgi:diguanylate cyclase (GGDEF)-like protein